MQSTLIQRVVDGRTDLVFDLVADGHPPHATDPNGVALIKWCAYYGDVSAVRFLVGHGATLASLGANLGLHDAVFHGHWQLCQFLVEHGADVNRPQADNGETPLHAALCKANRPAYDLVVQVLLAHGANPNCTTRPDAETGAFMRDCRTKAETPLHRAAAFGSSEAIQMLLDAGARVDTRDMHGDSPLAWASWHLRPDAILRQLCYGPFSVHPARHSTYDHGTGWGPMGVGRPHLSVSVTGGRLPAADGG
jgi:uncharacterized protein